MKRGRFGSTYRCVQCDGRRGDCEVFSDATGGMTSTCLEEWLSRNPRRPWKEELAAMNKESEDRGVKVKEVGLEATIARIKREHPEWFADEEIPF